MLNDATADFALASQLADPDRDALVAAGVTMTYAAGVFVHRAGDQKPGLSVVLEGRVRIGNLTEDGKLNAVMDCGAGFSFGELTSFIARSRTHDVVALSDARILQVPAVAVHDLCRQRPEIAFALLYTLAARLNLALESLEEFRGNAPAGRLASALLRRAASSPDGELVQVNQADIAHEIGVTRVTASKLLAAMEGEGILKRGYGCIHLLDKDRLALRVDR